MKVNQITKKDAEKYLGEAFAIFFERSLHEWTLDITYLDETLKNYNELPWWEK